MRSLKFYYDFKSKIILSLVIILFSYPVYSGEGSGGDNNSSDTEAHSSDMAKSYDYHSAIKNIKDGNFDDAIIELKNAAKSSLGGDPDIYVALGQAYQKNDISKKQNLDQAFDFYTKALKINPKHKEALTYQGEIFLARGQLDEAKKNIDNLIGSCWGGCDVSREFVANFKAAYIAKEAALKAIDPAPSATGGGGRNSPQGFIAGAGLDVGLLSDSSRSRSRINSKSRSRSRSSSRSSSSDKDADSSSSSSSSSDKDAYTDSDSDSDSDSDADSDSDTQRGTGVRVGRYTYRVKKKKKTPTSAP